LKEQKNLLNLGCDSGGGAVKIPHYA